MGILDKQRERGIRDMEEGGEREREGLGVGEKRGD